MELYSPAMSDPVSPEYASTMEMLYGGRRRRILRSKKMNVSQGDTGSIPVRHESQKDSKFAVVSNGNEPNDLAQGSEGKILRAKSIKYTTQGAYRSYSTVTPLDQLNEIPTFINCLFCDECTWTEVRRSMPGTRS